MTDYIHKYLDDLYRSKINQKDILKKEQISRSKLKKDMEKAGVLTPQQWGRKIDTGIPDLDRHMKSTYLGIVTRCNGRVNRNNKYALEHYKGMEYLPIDKWVEFCKKNRKILIKLWNSYIEHNKELKYQISIDRIDNSKGYVLGNIQFVSHGFNSWKRNVNPLKVKKSNEKWEYFMSGEEASKHYGIRRQSIGDLLRGQYREISKKFEVKHSTVEEVLKSNNIDTLENYYYRLKMFED